MMAFVDDARAKRPAERYENGFILSECWVMAGGRGAEVHASPECRRARSAGRWIANQRPWVEESDRRVLQQGV